MRYDNKWDEQWDGNDLCGPQPVCSPETYRSEAEKLLELAQKSTYPDTRKSLVELAMKYETLADHAEMKAQQAP
jgi:hypothetical protein